MQPLKAVEIVFISAGATTEGAAELFASITNAQLHKPFAPDELRRLIDRANDARRDLSARGFLPA